MLEQGMDSAHGNHGVLFPVSVRDKWGYIDRAGALVEGALFSAAQSFSEGLAAVVMNGKWGYIDSSARMVIPPRFGEAHAFSNGLALVSELGSSRRPCYISRKGMIVINPGCNDATDFHSGLATVTYWRRSKDTGLNEIDRTAVIDPTGRVLAQFDSILEFREGLAARRVGDKVGFVDATGAFSISPVFDSAMNFSEGLAAVEVEGKWGFVNASGTVVVSPQYDGAGHFSSGLASVFFRGRGGKLSELGKWGFIDTSGQFVVTHCSTTWALFLRGSPSEPIQN